MIDRLRLLPTVMLCAGLLLGLKLVHLAGGFEDLTAISTARASDAKPEVGEKPAKAEQGEAGEGDATAKAANAEAQAQLDAQTRQLQNPNASPAEVAVLESLSARRDEMDKRAKDLDMREQLLKAAEKRVGDRIAELKQIEARIQQQIGDNDKRNDERLAAVVKMYETMKPKDAARIFERLDMGVLIEVARRMEPRKMSAILAAMDPVTAQDLTVELATGDKLPDSLDGDKGEAPKAAPAAPQASVPMTAVPTAAAPMAAAPTAAAPDAAARNAAGHAG